jgi:hypothetical protein
LIKFSAAFPSQTAAIQEDIMGFLRRIDIRLGLFQQMSARAEVGFEGAGSFSLEHDLRRALTRCVFCRQAEACRQWLNGDTAGLYPNFCPNAAYLTRYGQAAAGKRDSLAA